jgi:uncharacterized damage-inducible protein DinB
VLQPGFVIMAAMKIRRNRYFMTGKIEECSSGIGFVTLDHKDTYMGQIKWFDRKFDGTVQQNIFPSIVERLAGTPARLDEKFAAIARGFADPSDILTRKVEGTWSIKENLGHLTDLEPLWQGRLEDIIKGATELRPTDLQNRNTDLANHNNIPVDELLYTFRQIRMKTLSMLEKIDETTIFRSALHPRLKTPMRTMDLFLFVTEHDDHHLARITDLVRVLKGG